MFIPDHFDIEILTWAWCDWALGTPQGESANRRRTELEATVAYHEAQQRMITEFLERWRKPEELFFHGRRIFPCIIGA